MVFCAHFKGVFVVIYEKLVCTSVWFLKLCIHSSPVCEMIHLLTEIELKLLAYLM
jgi:hypothetical protein